MKNDTTNSWTSAKRKPEFSLVKFVTQRLCDALIRLPNCQRVVMALSGGLDSCVLLHVLTTPSVIPEGVSLTAIHINHHLQPAATDFARHSQQLCQQLSVPFQQIDVTVALASGLGVEAAARNARYHAFASVLQSADLLIQAHHADDQIETFLLHLMRGSGVDGLSGMPAERPCGEGYLFRPLLEIRRSDLVAYAQAHQVSWEDDPTNQASEYDRNYLRHHVVPHLTARWPHAHQSVTQSIEHLRVAREQLACQTSDDYRAVASLPNRLNLSELRRLSTARQTRVIRYWVDLAGAPFPGRRRLMQALADFLGAGTDKRPELVWNNFRIDRYQNQLYLRRMPIIEPTLDEASFKYELGQLIELGNEGCFELRAVRGAGIAATCLQGAELLVRFRRGGEKVKLAENRPAQRLKEWLTEQNIAPWERDGLPLLLLGNDVVCVADQLICYPFSKSVAAGEEGWLPVWHPTDRSCASTPASKA